jgi:hypothetical protein
MTNHYACQASRTLLATDMLSESFNFSLFSILQEIESIQYNEKDFDGLPFDFHGGFVGYLGYVDFHDFITCWILNCSPACSCDTS